MDWYIWLIIGVCTVIAIFLAIVIIRTLCFKSPKENEREVAPLKIDENKAVSDLQAMVCCKTISCDDRCLEDDAEFLKFEKLLFERFPKIAKTCEFYKLSDRALLFKWKGKSSEKSSVLMSHYDVVSVEESLWSKPAFEGILENGVLWGRGVIDTKGTLNGAMQAVEHLIGEGFVPKNDIYLAFSGNEEINGDGAPTIVKWFKERGISPSLVCDEGGAVVDRVFPAVHQPCALIGIAEKGMLNVRFSIEGSGGHASSPPAKTALGTLSKACIKVEKKPFKRRISIPTKELFNTLGKRSNFLYRMIFANLWLFAGLLDKICKKTGGELNALMRTTVAFTQMQGSKGMNVLPPYAEMVANLRLMNGDTVDTAIERLTKIVNDDKIKVEKIYGSNPSNISKVDCQSYEIMKNAVSDTWQDAIVSPYLMLACSDSRHYGEISDYVYRFSAMRLSKEERASIHGNDEKLPVSTIIKTVEFYIRLINQI